MEINPAGGWGEQEEEEEEKKKKREEATGAELGDAQRRQSCFQSLWEERKTRSSPTPSKRKEKKTKSFPSYPIDKNQCASPTDGKDTNSLSQKKQ
ncbi:hypothetical protein OUZ56_013829 [Daphnia magna]|uniref:Uncharacterized protein n=1 Tax=Daphnia magna TaxID=35525 RepID=A0ABQ9Z740_9CRUS|nr:hypothetical protein OUZ56_013829 [Daphnia magna]